MTMAETRLAINLYTLREYLKTYDDFEKTLEKVKKTGYEVIQMSGVGPVEPFKMKAVADKLGLKICATHIDLDRLRSDFDGVVEEQWLYDCKHLAIPLLPRDYTGSGTGYRIAAKELSGIGKKLAAKGIVLSYHNHHYEFEKFGNKVGLEILFEESEREYLKAEIDTFWVQYGGGDPVEWIKRLKGRIPLIHLKDMGIREGKQVFMEVGEGNLNWEAILDACRESGVEWYIVEQDETLRPPFESIRISRENLIKMGVF